MGLFISPRERGAQSLFDMIMRGQTPADAIFESLRRMSTSQIQSDALSEMSRGSQDILSMAESAGVTFGSGLDDLISKTKANARRNELARRASVDQAMFSSRGNLLSSLFPTAIGQMGDTTTMGDILGGLTSLANLGTGIFNLGSESKGFGLWKG